MQIPEGVVKKRVTANSLAIPLANTVRVENGETIDAFETIESFVAWAESVRFYTAFPMTWEQEDYHDVRLVRDVLREGIEALIEDRPITDYVVNTIEDAAAAAEVLRRIGNVDGRPIAWLELIGDPGPVAVAYVANHAMDLLVSPERHSLAVCAASDCSNYFVQQHGRQKYCDPTCSARARQARRREG